MGINEYANCAPLRYAVNDAMAIKRTLVERFAFLDADTVILTDSEAARDNIRRSFLSFTDTGSGPDDRIIFFFAGHGHTVRGRRGEVGYLVPFDGKTVDLSSLIRWDELTRSADLIPAKHLFFVMDACYGGLATLRALQPGSMRFLKDMLRRPCRQVLTAGKADEVVSDAGGPLDGHSVFTGHLLEAMSGKARTSEGMMTANGIMSYVYERVGRDPESHQTPHFGFLDGDGDFVFETPELVSLEDQEETEQDMLVTVPGSSEATGADESTATVIRRAKEFLSDPTRKIALHDLVAQEVRRYLARTAEENFGVQGVPFTVEEFQRRLERYETLTSNLQAIGICLGRWVEEPHLSVLQMAVTRPTDRLDRESGLVVWLWLRWYPTVLMTYAAGIAAVAAGNHENLKALLTARIGGVGPAIEEETLVLAVGQARWELADAFKKLPGHERQIVPMNEYLFKHLQPSLDDLLFLGRDYERFFDRFEVLMALIHADLSREKYGSARAPFGRFYWKLKSLRGSDNPFMDVKREAEQLAEEWEPLRVGFFQGSLDRFMEVAGEYEQFLLGRR